MNITNLKILVAGPTCGKTTLIQKNNDVQIMDSDLVVESIQSVVNEIKNDESMDSRFWNESTVEFRTNVSNIIKYSWDGLILTNLWEMLPQDSFAVFRESADEIKELLDKRENGFSWDLEVIQSWISDLKQKDNIAWLKEGEYLQDIISVSADGFSLIDESRLMVAPDDEEVPASQRPNGQEMVSNILKKVSNG